MLRAMKNKMDLFSHRIESRKHERKRKTRKRDFFQNPPLKRRAILVCPFKGAFSNIPALLRLGEEIWLIQYLSIFCSFRQADGRSESFTLTLSLRAYLYPEVKGLFVMSGYAMVGYASL